MKTTIGAHCTVTSSKRFHLSERTDDGIPFYCSKQIIQLEHGEEPTDYDYIQPEYYENIREKFGVPRAGDLLITTRGTYGIPYIYRKNDCFYFADGNLTWLKDFDNALLPQYLYYWIQSYEGQKKIDAIAKGTAQKAVPISSIKDVPLELPTVAYQNRVCSILSAYDDLIENNRCQIKLLEEAAQRLYREWFVELRFLGHEDVKIVDGLPEGWEKKRLIGFADIVMGQSPKSEYFNENNIGLPFHQGVGSYGHRFVQNRVYTSQCSRIADAGSILFSVRAPVGRLNFTKNKVAIGRGLAGMNHKEGFQHYLYYLLKDRYFKDDIVGNGSIFASINKEELQSQEFIVPTHNVVSQFEALVTDIDKKIEILDTQLEQLMEAHCRLLPKLMSGEIEV